MPALFAPALDLGALVAVLVALALTVLAYKIAQSIAGVLNFSILGIHPLGNVAHALENTIVQWLGQAVTELEDIARDLFHGLVWMWGEFLDGVNSLTTHVEHALGVLWDTSIPNYVRTALHPVVKSVAVVEAEIDAVTGSLASEVDRLDAKIASTAKATTQTLTRDISQAVARETASIDAEIRGIRSSVDQAIQHALDLARSESQEALGTLRRAEDAAIGAVGAAAGATADELHDLINTLNPAEVAGLIAAVPILAQLVQTIAAESGLDNAICRGKVKDICSTPGTDWSWLLTGVGVLGFGMSLREIIDAGREVVHYVESGAEDLAELG